MKQVKAWQDSEGDLHDNEADAARAEAKHQLKKLLGDRANVCVLAVMQNAPAILKVLRDWDAIDGGIEPLHIGPSRSQRTLAEVEDEGQFDERYPANTVGPL